MNITPFQREDIYPFMAMATAECWMVETWELDFLQEVSPQGCYCARDKVNKGIGFVTSLAHGRSGWIGNLIVSPEYRGSGIGRQLFIKARDILYKSGSQTIWLTASKAGRSLYEKHGFSDIDSVIRWSGFGSGSSISITKQESAPEPSIDHLGWGDNRDRLLAATAARGRVLSSDRGFVVIQPCSRSVQIGPFAALNTSYAKKLLDDALAAIPPEVKIYIDAPAGNWAGADLLRQRGFTKQGTNDLMYAGARPAYHPEYIYGLASMGSMG